jgi:hypothetical protein
MKQVSRLLINLKKIWRITMKAHRIETTLTENGTLTIKDLPFQAGEAVEIIILERSYQPSESNPYP